MKTHFAVKPPMDATAVSACGRGKRIDANVRRVDCLLCQNTDQFIIAKDEDDTARYNAFMAQEPREYGEPWKEGIITCKNGHTKFRDAGRSCYGHYQDYKCAECGDLQSRLTETGMSF